MRQTLFIALVLAVAGCGDDTTSATGGTDMSVADLSGTGGGGDMTAIQPFNMPGHVFCYGSLTCSSPTQVCCDLRVAADGGSSFMTSCAAMASACPTGAATYECGQAADCGSGQICCGTQGSTGKGLKSTNCATSCTSGQIQLCVTKTECKTGTMCVGEDLSGRAVGVCQ